MKSKKIIESVKKLRLETRAGIMDCKKALEKTKGNLEKAKEILGRRAVVKAQKKAGKKTNQGYVATYTHNNGKIGAMIELLSETDFVARNQEFRNLAKELCLQVAAMAPKNLRELLTQDYIRDPGRTIGQLIKETIAKFGENIRIGRFKRFEI